MRKSYSLLALSLVSLLLASCSSPHFFPRTQPLFAGLDESRMSTKSQQTIAKAKVDFRLAQKGMTPQYAKYIHTIPHTRSKVYEGDGYRVTMVKEDNSFRLRTGPEIVVSSCITGGRAYRYDEVDEVAD
jgi:hypothetical protein